MSFVRRENLAKKPVPLGFPLLSSKVLMLPLPSWKNSNKWLQGLAFWFLAQGWKVNHPIGRRKPLMYIYIYTRYIYIYIPFQGGFNNMSLIYSLPPITRIIPLIYGIFRKNSLYMWEIILVRWGILLESKDHLKMCFLLNEHTQGKY